MPQARHKEVIDAPFARVSELLIDKMERPKKYVGPVLHSRVLERGDGHIVREMFLPKPVPLTVREKIYYREIPDGQEFIYEHLNNADYTGEFRNVLTRVDGRDDKVELEYVMDWRPHPGTNDKMSDEVAQRNTENAVKHMKELAENPVVVPDFVRTFFDAVDSKNTEAFEALFADRCKFRVGNNPEILGRENIAAMNREVLKKFASIQHDYVAVYSDKGRTLVETWVEYVMPDGKAYLLPFMTAFERSGDKLAGVAIFGDMSPLTYGWGEAP